MDWGRSLLLVQHICICLLNSKTSFLCKHKYSPEKEERGESCIHFIEHGHWALCNPMPELTLSFNSQKMTMNLGSAAQAKVVLKEPFYFVISKMLVRQVYQRNNFLCNSEGQ